MAKTVEKLKTTSKYDLSELVMCLHKELDSR